jgi:hypothetical protein
VTDGVRGPRGSQIVRATAVLARFPTDSPVNIDLSVPIWTIEHVAAALHLEVDTAREYTYREDFPRPRAGFAKNLWTRAEVLDWFAELAPKPRGRATVSTAAVVRTAPRPAGTRPASAPAGTQSRRRPDRRRPEAVHAEAEVSPARRPLVETIGVVDIYAPTSDPYFRLKWAEPDGTLGDTTAGRTLNGARLKAAEIDARVGSAAGPAAVTRLDRLQSEPAPPPSRREHQVSKGGRPRRPVRLERRGLTATASREAAAAAGGVRREFGSGASTSELHASWLPGLARSPQR